MIKNPSAMQEIQFQSSGWEDPLEKGMATHSSILLWKIPRTEEPCGLQSMGSQEIRGDWVTNTFTFSWRVNQRPLVLEKPFSVSQGFLSSLESCAVLWQALSKKGKGQIRSSRPRHHSVSGSQLHHPCIRDLNLGFGNSLAGWDGERGAGMFKWDVTRVNLWLIHVDVW